MSTQRSKVEKYIGRELYTTQFLLRHHPEYRFCRDVEEVVHHIDTNRLNNELSNLYVFRNNGDHTDYHLLIKKWAIGLCGKTFDEKVDYLKSFPDLHSNLDKLKELHKNKQTLSYYKEQEHKPLTYR